MGVAKRKVRVIVGSYWANEFKVVNCNDKALKFCDDIAEGFGRAMKKHGHSWAINRGSNLASSDDFTEPSDKVKNSGVDTVHFAILATHGRFDFDDRSHPQPDEYSFFCTFGVIGKKTGVCWWNNLHKPSYRGSFKTHLGNNKLKWLIVDACESLQLERPNSKEHKHRLANPRKQWEHTFHGLNMIFGFTEESSDSSWTSDRGADFGHKAGSGKKLKNAWLDVAYSWWVDDYPVAMGCGRNSKDSLERIKNERINSRFPRIPNKQTKSYKWYWYD